jgi:hypothetical protein
MAASMRIRLFVRRTLLRSYKVKLSVCHVLSEIFAVRPLFPQLHLDDARKLYDLEAAVRDALLKRIRTVTAREPPQIEIEIEQRTVRAGILRAANNIGAGAVGSSGGRSITRVCTFWAALRSRGYRSRSILVPIDHVSYVCRFVDDSRVADICDRCIVDRRVAAIDSVHVPPAHVVRWDVDFPRARRRIRLSLHPRGRFDSFQVNHPRRCGGYTVRIG